jgi:uncharacterized membrane protein
MRMEKLSEMFIFFDIGVSNFCYLICELTDKKIKVIDFDIVRFGKNIVGEVISFLDDTPRPEKFFIEVQYHKNSKCTKIETVILTYLTINNLRYKKVHPFHKIKVLNLDSSSYSVRKKSVIEHGKIKLKETIISDQLLDKLDELKKQDDFFDCLLMAWTELSTS